MMHFFHQFPPSAANTRTDMYTYCPLPYCVYVPLLDKFKLINIVTHRSPIMKWLCLASCDFSGPLFSRFHIVWGVERSRPNHK